MATVQEHYNSLLGPIYSWMMGDFEEGSSQNSRQFDKLKIQPIQTGVAIDLGCGHGLQSVPLSRRGFNVFAFDTCEPLLNELRERVKTASLSIEPIHEDLINFSKYAPPAFDIAVCMGDTITHLPKRDSVRSLFQDVGNLLVSGGRFILSLRDYVSTELKGSDRFIPVKSDDRRIHTCFLEYEPNVVQVHDLIYTKKRGSWIFDVSSYPKLRLDIGWVESELSSAGLHVVHSQTKNGMATIVGAAS